MYTHITIMAWQAALRPSSAACHLPCLAGVLPVRRAGRRAASVTHGVTHSRNGVCAAAGGRTFSAGPPAVPERAPASPDDVFLPRSVLMDKEVITRTSGKRLGYVNQLFVDPARLEVVSVYLRPGATSLGAVSSEHVLLSSLRQIGDVVLVHDESALLDPPADDTYGYLKLVGTEVQTEEGTSLGKVRDFIFNPDNGQVASIRYDALGFASIPQALLTCYSLSWEDVVAVGPTKTIVRRGAERRAVKENDGWVSEYVSALITAVAGPSDGEVGMEDAEGYRSDPAYAEWYAVHAAEYERYYQQKLPMPITAQQPRQVDRRQRQQAPPPSRPQPMALPPPSSRPYRQVVQAQRQPANQAQQQHQQQRTRQPVGGSAGPPRQTVRRAAPAPLRQAAPQSTAVAAQYMQRRDPSGNRAAGPPGQRKEMAFPAQGETPPASAQVPALEPDAVIPGEQYRPRGSAAPRAQRGEYAAPPPRPR